MAALVSLVPVGIVTVLGIGLSYFGYEVAQKVLAVAGAVGGLGVGLFVGGYLYPSVTGDQQVVVVTLVLGVVGLVLGRVFVPALSQLAFGLAGFVVTSLSVLGFLTRGRFVDIVLAAAPTTPAEVNPVSVVERIAAAPVFQGTEFDQSVLIAVGAGLVGGVIALKFYDEFVAVATTAIGASVLGLTIPLLLEAYRGATVVDGSAAEFSVFWFAVVFLTGSAFELYRNREEMSLI